MLSFRSHPRYSSPALGCPNASSRLSSRRLRLFRDLYRKMDPPGLNEEEAERPPASYRSTNAVFTRGVKTETPRTWRSVKPLRRPRTARSGHDMHRFIVLPPEPFLRQEDCKVVASSSRMLNVRWPMAEKTSLSLDHRPLIIGHARLCNPPASFAHAIAPGEFRCTIIV